MIEPGGVRIGKGLGDVEADMARAPSIRESNVEQMGAETELERDADMVELVIPAAEDASFDRGEERFCVVIAGPA